MTFRVGIVQEQDVGRARVRVVFPDYDQMISWWLFVVTPKTQSDKAYWMPDIGEQVVCLMDAHDEDGAVLGAIYSDVDTSPVQSCDKWHVTMQDGAQFEYDRAAHQFFMQLPTGASMTISVGSAGSQSTIQIDSSGNVNITANQSINLAAANGAINLISAQDITLETNSYDTSVNAIANTYDSHVHPDPQGGVTGMPNQQITQGDLI